MDLDHARDDDPHAVRPWSPLPRTSGPPVIAPVAGGSITLVHWNIAYGMWGSSGRGAGNRSQKGNSVRAFGGTPGLLDLPAAGGRLGPGYDAVRVGGMAFIADGQLQGRAAAGQ